MSKKRILFFMPVLLIFMLAFGGCGGEDSFVDSENVYSENYNNDSETLSMKEFVVASNDAHVNINEKNVTAPQISDFRVTPDYFNKKSIGDTDGTKSAMATGSGADPWTAPQISSNSTGGYQYTLDYVGAQNWFYTQAVMTGQMTVHLDVPQSPTIDYDLYVLTYSASTATIYAYKSSTRYAKNPEHISFKANIGDIYFICIEAYQGFSTTSPYTLQVEMANLTVGEVDDFPENARTFPLNNSYTGASGTLSMRNDEDYFKFQSNGNKAYLFVSTNAYTIVEVLKQNGTAVDVIYQLPSAGIYLLEGGMTSGVTYYIRVRHTTNQMAGLVSNYKVEVNSFNCSYAITNLLGRQNDGSRVAYLADDRLYVNSECMLDGYVEKCRYSYEEGLAPTYYKHDSYATGRPMAAFFVEYTTYGGVVDSIYDALELVISGDVVFENSKQTYVGKDIHSGAVSHASYILDISDKQVKDLASRVGNGFYNGFFGNNNFDIDDK